MARADRTGRQQRQKTATARSRKPDLSRYYGRRLPQITPGEFAFALDIPRYGRAGRSLPLDSFVESFDWAEDDERMRGSVTFRRQDIDEPQQVPVERGTLIRCRVRWDGRWYELWTMRVESPEVDLPSGQVRVQLVDDMAIVRRGHRRYEFRKGKRRPQGWFGHEALRVAARKDGIRLGRIARCTRRRDKIVVRGSFLDLARKVYIAEREATGRRFVLRMRNGRFEAIERGRNRIVYELANMITGVTISREPVTPDPVTVLTGRARVGRGRDRRPVRVTVYDRRVVNKLGYSHRVRDFGRLPSEAELRRRVKRELARNLRTRKVISVDAPGIPFIRRGDAVRVVVPSEGLRGDDSFVFVTSIRHAVDPGSYRMNLECTDRDPIYAMRRQREREQRRAKSQKRSDG